MIGGSPRGKEDPAPTLPVFTAAEIRRSPTWFPAGSRRRCMAYGSSACSDRPPHEGGRYCAGRESHILRHSPTRRGSRRRLSPSSTIGTGRKRRPSEHAIKVW